MLEGTLPESNGWRVAPSPEPLAWFQAAARPGWKIVGDGRSRKAIEAVTRRHPELRPLLAGVTLFIRPRLQLPYRVPDGTSILLAAGRSASASTLLRVRHALEIAMWRRLLGAGGHLVHEIAASALALRTTLEYAQTLPPGVRSAAVEDAPAWLRVDAAADLTALVRRWPELLPLQAIEVGRVRPDEGALEAAACLSRELAPAASPTERLLTLGGDSRLLVDPLTRLNKYGCSPAPRPEAITFSSCTATSASDIAFVAAEEGRQRLLRNGLATGSLAAAAGEAAEGTRRELRARLGVDDVPGAELFLAASGTDCELVALDLALCGHGAAVTNIVIGPDEIGSGSVAASGGLHFDPIAPLAPEVRSGAPLDGLAADRVQVEPLPLRDQSGAPVALERLDADAGSMVEAAVARGARVLLHLLDGSKTGLRAPSVQSARRLHERFAPAVDVIVDSAQGRTSRNVFREYLEAGFMILVTGSKFFTGSPFSGALIVPPAVAARLDGLARLPDGFAAYLSAFEVPPRWAVLRDRLPASPNLGLLLRWQAALQEIRAFDAVPDDLQRAWLQSFHDGLLRIVGEYEGMRLVEAPVGDRRFSGPRPRWDAVRTIFTLLVASPGDARGDSLSFDEAWQLYCCLNSDVSERLPLRAGSREREVAAKACHVGQPVRLKTAAGRVAGAMRLAVGARFVSRVAFDPTLGPDPDARIAAQLEDVRHVLDKMLVVLRYWREVVDQPATT